MIVLNVLGTPAPKGSARAIMRGGHAVSVPSGSDANKANLRSWDVAVRQAALEAVSTEVYRTFGTISTAAIGPLFEDTPLAVTIVFRMRAPKKRHAAPMTKPDIDKLARATLDALHGSVFDDDSRVVSLTLLKVYADPGREGAQITVRAWSPVEQTVSLGCTIEVAQ